MNTNKARNLDCLYNVYDAKGMLIERLTDREVTDKYGPGLWEYYTERVDHSEWCNQPHERLTTWVDGSPVSQTDTPPF